MSERNNQTFKWNIRGIHDIFSASSKWPNFIPQVGGHFFHPWKRWWINPRNRKNRGKYIILVWGSSDTLTHLGGGNSNIFGIFVPTWRRFPFWPNIFQMGWFNHQRSSCFFSWYTARTYSPNNGNDVDAFARRSAWDAAMKQDRFFTKDVRSYVVRLLMEEIQNNHLGCNKPCK